MRDKQAPVLAFGAVSGEGSPNIIVQEKNLNFSFVLATRVHHPVTASKVRSKALGKKYPTLRQREAEATMS